MEHHGFKAPPIRFSVSTGKWDQVFTLGTKNKDGEEIVIDESACAAMMDNFAARENDLGMDYEHVTAVAGDIGVPAPQLAFYSALALVVGGRVAKFSTHDESVPPPAVDGMTDGLFAYRCKVTPLGDELLPNYAYISPYFTMADQDEAGNEIGPNLLNISAVSVPFQDGCAIQFSNAPQRGAARALAKGTAMADDIMKRLGLDDDASPDAMKAAMGAYLKKMDDDVAAKKLADDEAMKKMADADGDDDKDKKPFADDADAEKMDDGDPAEMDDGDAMKKMSKAALIEQVKVLKLSHAPKTEFAKLSNKVAELESKLAEAAKAKTLEAAVKFAKSAVADGRWNPAEEQALVDVRANDPALAEKALQPRGTWTVLQRYTKGGSPSGVEREAAADLSGASESVIGADLSVEAKKFAKANGVSLIDAMATIAAQKPQAYKRGA